MKLTNKQFYILLASAAAAALLIKDNIERGVSSGLGYVNPVDSNNIFYSSANSVGGALTGEDNLSLGAWIYDKTH
jgi:hypothetical protein